MLHFLHVVHIAYANTLTFCLGVFVYLLVARIRAQVTDFYEIFRTRKNQLDSGVTQ